MTVLDSAAYEAKALKNGQDNVRVFPDVKEDMIQQMEVESKNYEDMRSKSTNMEESGDENGAKSKWGRTVFLNLFPVSQDDPVTHGWYNWDTDVPLLLRNCVLWAARDVPTKRHSMQYHMWHLYNAFQ